MASWARRQRGVALLNALVIIAIVAAVAARITRDEFDMRVRVDLMMRSDQALAYARSAEALAMQLLEAEWEQKSTDHLGEGWAEADRTFAIEGGMVRGQIVDLQGRFNLNAIRNREGNLDAVGYAILQRLLASAGAERRAAPRLAEWILGDSAPVQETRGDAPYLSDEDQPFVRSRAPLMGASELRPIDGVSGAVFARLQPLVTALPEATTINVNTAPPAVLAALAPGIRLSDVNRAIAGRQNEPFGNPAEFLDRLEERVSPLAADTLGRAPLGVSSEWYMIEIYAEADTGRATLHSMVFRSKDDGSVVPHLRLENGP